MITMKQSDFFLFPHQTTKIYKNKCQYTYSNRNTHRFRHNNHLQIPISPVLKTGIYQFVLGKIIPYLMTKNNPLSTSVPTIQTVKGRVVFFRKGREKISTLKPLTVWIFAARISPPKTGNRIKKSCPRFRLLHSNGKTVCTTAAAVVRFCGGSAPAPPTSPKEQNGVLRNRA